MPTECETGDSMHPRHIFEFVELCILLKAVFDRVVAKKTRLQKTFWIFAAKEADWLEDTIIGVLDKSSRLDSNLTFIIHVRKEQTTKNVYRQVSHKILDFVYTDTLCAYIDKATKLSVSEIYCHVSPSLHKVAYYTY